MAVAEPIEVDDPIRPFDAGRRVRGRSRYHNSRLDRAAIWFLVAVTILAVFVPVIAPHSPTVPVGNPYLPPGHGGALLGTDEVGRDILSRVLYGMRTSWFAALAIIACGIVVGGTVGLVAGSVGGVVDIVLMRITDFFLALPGPLLAISVAAALGPSFAHTLTAVAIVWWPFYARIVRGEVRALVVRPHLEAARLAGTSGARRALLHLFPGVVPSLLVAASLGVGALLLTLAALSFLGLGAPEPAPELGAMTAQGMPFVLSYWWIPTMPALAVLVLAFMANLAGDGIRDLFSDI